MRGRHTAGVRGHVFLWTACGAGRHDVRVTSTIARDQLRGLEGALVRESSPTISPLGVVGEVAVDGADEPVGESSGRQ
jgi:hypothetical protein